MITELKKIVEYGITNNMKPFETWMLKLLDELQIKPDKKNEIITMFNSNRTKNSGLNNLYLFNNTCSDIILPNDIVSKNLILSQKIQSEIDKFITLYKNTDLLISHNLTPILSLLLVGESGTGKTSVAYQIAKTMNLPLISTNISTIISSYLGETSKKINDLFNRASEIPCVLFFDEFDSLGKKRNDERDVSELSRVVDSLLYEIDKFLSKGGILICASNFELILDSALFRRFNIRIEFEKPTTNQIKELISSVLHDIKMNFSDNFIDFVSPYFIEKSHDFIVKTLRGVTSICLINGSDTIHHTDVCNYIGYKNEM